jgi:hypothetical protein
MMLDKEGKLPGGTRRWYLLAVIGFLIAVGAGLLAAIAALPSSVGTFFVVLGLFAVIGSIGIAVTKTRQR